MNIKWTSNEHQMNIKWNPKMKIKWRYVPVRTSLSNLLGQKMKMLGSCNVALLTCDLNETNSFLWKLLLNKMLLRRFLLSFMHFIQKTLNLYFKSLPTIKYVVWRWFDCTADVVPMIKQSAWSHPADHLLRSICHLLSLLQSLIRWTSFRFCKHFFQLNHFSTATAALEVQMYVCLSPLELF